MPDREKVIRAIECRKNAHKRCGNPCERTGYCAYAAWIRDPDGTPYYPCYCDVERLCDDALALLREQEPVNPYVDARDGWYRCGKCGNSLASGERVRSFGTYKWPVYCEKCGRKVKWNDAE